MHRSNSSRSRNKSPSQERRQNNRSRDLICEGGDFNCVIDDFDPNDGLEACTRKCQASWTNEQDPACVSDASFVIECVDANGSCDTLDEATCDTAEDDLIACATGG